VSSAADRSRGARLPRSVLPRRYELQLEPHLDRATFDGHVRIELEVHERVAEIVCNSAGLQIAEAWIFGPAGLRARAQVELREDFEQVAFRLPESLPSGDYQLEISFSGALSDSLHGLYRSRFFDQEGKEHILAATQFEPTDARRAFPCWDEPDFKASFAVSLVVPDGMFACSNGKEIVSESLGDGRRLVRFKETIPMSSYLVAALVGPMEATPVRDVDGVELRVIHVPGKAHLSDFALQVAEHALRYFTDYFDIPYPSDKLDLAAIPDFAFGAMENLGAVFFRESSLLVDPTTASVREIQRVADVVCHEIAHMWFGDLATMAWWDDLWLNEAFATLMEVHAVDAFRPQWEREVSFGLELSRALEIDGLSSTRPIKAEVASPADAEAMFDALTYQKGAAVLRMLENYLGPDVFAAGVRRYLRRHRLSNATAADLWTALEEASKQPIGSLVEDWLSKPGHPLIEAGREHGRLRLRQRRFAYHPSLEEGSWLVPLRVKVADDPNSPIQVLLPPEGTSLELQDPRATIVANSEGASVVRCLYELPLAELLRKDLRSLTPLERHSLVRDAWATTLAGLSPLEEFFSWVQAMGANPFPGAWEEAIGAAHLLYNCLEDGQLEAFISLARHLFGPLARSLGTQSRPDEAPLVKALRSSLLSFLGTAGEDSEIGGWASSALEADWAGLKPLDPDLARAVLAIAAWRGDGRLYEQYLERWEKATSPQEELRYLYSLTAFRDPDLVQRTLELAWGKVRSQNAPAVVQLCLASRHGGRITWRFLTAHWDAFLSKISPTSLDVALEGLSHRGEPDLLEEARGFLEVNVPANTRQKAAQVIEQMEVNVRFGARERGGFEALAQRLLGRSGG